MFDLLKNKLSNFISNVKKSVSKPAPEEEKVVDISQRQETVPTPIEIAPVPKPIERALAPPAPAPKQVERVQVPIAKTVESKPAEQRPVEQRIAKPVEKPVVVPAKSLVPEIKAVIEKKPVVVQKEEKRIEKKDERKEDKKEIKTKPVAQVVPATPTKPVVTTVTAEKKEVEAATELKPAAAEKRADLERGVRKEPEEKAEVTETAGMNVKPSFLTRIQGFILPTVKIKESDVRDVLEDLELQLIEADVAMPVAQAITAELKERLVGQQIKFSEFDAFVKRSILDSIKDAMVQETIDIVSFSKKILSEGKKPVRILFVGPNGHGKTTTIAKIASLLKKNGLSCVMSASDTFRAAAIEQTVEHGRRLNIPVIKHQYGSDPSAVAFDAIKYAEAHNIDVVLIDTAGRQETSRNLIEQLKKIERVAAPHLKLFVGEGIVGHAIIQQVSEFNAAINLDGVILTKVDCDTKGGSVISVKKATGVPILYLAVGQGYDDLILFDEKFVLSKLMA
jgi:fused signal recognition particle receptor